VVHTVVWSPLPRQVSGSRRSTRHGGGIRLREADATLRNAIQMRCFVERFLVVLVAIVAGDILPAEIVNEDVNDVWLRRALGDYLRNATRGDEEK